MLSAFKSCADSFERHYPSLPTPFGREQYETWYNVELAIRKFDRIFNRVEKFNARKFNDPDNHERREKRMLERKRQRVVDNYTIYFGRLTEEEMQYRDYFESDLEHDPENEQFEELSDKASMAHSGQFNPKLFDFIDANVAMNIPETHENYDDIVEDKLFKYRYRQNADSAPVFNKRMERVRSRFMERAKSRDPAIDNLLWPTFVELEKNTMIGNLVLNREKFVDSAADATTAHREYMAREGVQQYRDYYESDAEEQGFFEYLDNLPNRDRIRFMEAFKDFTVQEGDGKGLAMIPKREFNPEISAF